MARVAGLRLRTGIALAGVPAMAMAYVAEEVDAASVDAAMGLYIAGSALGGMGGRLASSLLASIAGWRAALALVEVVGLIMTEAFRRAGAALAPLRGAAGAGGRCRRRPEGAARGSGVAAPL